MKKKAFFLSGNNGIRLLCVGLALLLLNTWLELGVLSDTNVNNSLNEWCILALTILSKFTSAIGIALIISYITSYINSKYIDGYKALSDQQAFEHTKAIVSRFSRDKEYLMEYKNASVLKVLNNYPNCRTDVRYSVEAFVTDNKVHTRTFLSYNEYKTDGFYRISNYSDDQGIQVKNIKVSAIDNTNASQGLDNVKEEEHKAFSQSKKYEKYVDIPPNFQKMDAIHVEKELVITGEDHWQSYAAIFLTPSRGVSFSLNARDGLKIKDVIIFGDDGSFSITLNEQRNTVNITSSSWIAADNGIFVLIAKS